MDFVQQAILAVLRRAKWFLEQHAAGLGALAEAPALTRLDDLIRALETNGAVQHGSVTESHAATETKYERRQQLRLQHMAPISAVARAKLAGIPAPKMAKFNVPTSDASDVTLLFAGRAMHTAAKEYEQVFKDEKLGEDVLDQLSASIDALQETIVSRDGDKLLRRRATLGNAGLMQLARQVLDMLTGIVMRAFLAQPDIIGQWKTAIRIGGKPGGSRKQPVPTPVPIVGSIGPVLVTDTNVEEERRAA